MDDTDRRIVAELKNDARTPFLRIAKQLQVSEGTIRKRVKDMVHQGIIQRFTLETKDELFAIVGVQTETHTETKKIVQTILQTGVTRAFEVTGRFDIICMVPSSDMHTVNMILEQIRSIPGVQHTETFTVLEKN